MLPQVIQQLIERKDLTQEQAQAAMEGLIAGAEAAQIGAFLVLLRAKGETPEEVAGLAAAMRSMCVEVAAGDNTLDIVGTGGDGFDTVNISTGACVLAAACGAHVAKHGNRSVSSACGSADVLEALNVEVDLGPQMTCGTLCAGGGGGLHVCVLLSPLLNHLQPSFLLPSLHPPSIPFSPFHPSIPLPFLSPLSVPPSPFHPLLPLPSLPSPSIPFSPYHPFLPLPSLSSPHQAVARCVQEAGVGFMYAPRFHPAMRIVAPVRKALKVRTAFNLLGPMLNPSFAPYALVGVFNPETVDLMARSLQRLGIRRALVVHSKGLDEISPMGMSSPPQPMNHPFLPNPWVSPADMLEVTQDSVRPFRVDP
ncbi:unnamed protein product, partial [Closterium sp. NIES-64]